jgi:hypothetical protein
MDTGGVGKRIFAALSFLMVSAVFETASRTAQSTAGTKGSALLAKTPRVGRGRAVQAHFGLKSVRALAE